MDLYLQYVNIEDSVLYKNAKIVFGKGVLWVGVHV